MEVIAEEVLKISKRKIRSIISDPKKTAEAIHLIYVHDTQPGIKCIKKGNNFDYVAAEAKKIINELNLQRIRSLVIPPAWESVWICELENGHLQATGIDVKKRKQYKYHVLWNALRNHTKYFRLYQFGKVLPAIRLQVERDLSLPGLPVEKVLALVVRVIETTNIRVGNTSYEKLYSSFGLTTLKNKHVNISGNELKFSFRGKKGVHHDISLRNKKLSALVKKLPGYSR